MLDALANFQPIVVAMFVFSEFMTLSVDNSTVPIPGDSSIIYGGHAVCIVGYDTAQQAFLAKNSFGTEWGDQGYCWIPFEYVSAYVFEQWIFEISKQ
jgi:C1A family cysteine protease